jgi:hypothetical protein
MPACRLAARALAVETAGERKTKRQIETKEEKKQKQRKIQNELLIVKLSTIKQEHSMSDVNNCCY